MNLVLPLLLIVFILTLSAVWTIPRGAPWVPTSPALVREMLDLARIKPGERVYDLGCGDGRFLIAAAREYGARGVGIELDPLRWLWCWLRIRFLGLADRVEVHFGDLFALDLGEADVVTCYLLPDSMGRLQEKLLRELRPEVRVVSNTFLFPGMQEVEISGKARLYRFSPEHAIETYLRQQTSGSRELP